MQTKIDIQTESKSFIFQTIEDSKKLQSGRQTKKLKKLHFWQDKIYSMLNNATNLQCLREKNISKQTVFSLNIIYNAKFHTKRKIVEKKYGEKESFDCDKRRFDKFILHKL